MPHGEVLLPLGRCPPLPCLAVPGVRPAPGRGAPRWDLGATCLVAPGVRGLPDRVSSWDQRCWSRVLWCLADMSDNCHPGGVPLGVDTILGRLGVPAPCHMDGDRWAFLWIAISLDSCSGEDCCDQFVRGFAYTVSIFVCIAGGFAYYLLFSVFIHEQSC